MQASGGAIPLQRSLPVHGLIISGQRDTGVMSAGIITRDEACGIKCGKRRESYEEAGC